MANLKKIGRYVGGLGVGAAGAMTGNPALIGAGASIVTSGMASDARAKTAREQREANRMMSEKAFEREKEMWKLQRQYDSPVKQMERLKEAGLNPALVYGTGTVTGNTAGQYPQYQVPQQPFDYTPQVNPMEMMDSYLGTQQKRANIERTAMDAVLKDVEVGIKGIKHVRENAIQRAMQENYGYEKQVKAYLEGLGKAKAERVGQELKNYYQNEVNKLIDKGLTPGDSVKIRIGYKLFDWLGMDTNWMDNLLNSVPNLE